MKRSEMLELYKNEYGSERIIIAFVDQVLAFFEKHGMQPPDYVKEVSFRNGKITEVFYGEWEPEEDENNK